MKPEICAAIGVRPLDVVRLDSSKKACSCVGTSSFYGILMLWLPDEKEYVINKSRHPLCDECFESWIPRTTFKKGCTCAGASSKPGISIDRAPSYGDSLNVEYRVRAFYDRPVCDECLKPWVRYAPDEGVDR